MEKGASKFPLSGWEVAAGLGVVVSFGIGLLAVYLSMPPSDYSFLKLPRTLEELQTLRLAFDYEWNGTYLVRDLTGRMSPLNLPNGRRVLCRQGIEDTVNALMDREILVSFLTVDFTFSRFKIHMIFGKSQYQRFGITF